MGGIVKKIHPVNIKCKCPLCLKIKNGRDLCDCWKFVDDKIVKKQGDTK